MLTPKQEKWILHFDTKKIKIVPYDPKVKLIFNKVEKEIQEILGKTKVEHRGATSLGISGQGEIDLYIPVSENLFQKYLKKLVNYFGKPGSIYPLRRVRFVKYVDGIKIEIFLINREAEDWKDCIKFENYLKKHSEVLREYKKLKEECNGLTTQEYYRKKLEFISRIINLSSKIV